MLGGGGGGGGIEGGREGRRGDLRKKDARRPKAIFLLFTDTLSTLARTRSPGWYTSSNSWAKTRHDKTWYYVLG